jgi:hypothetical protein
MLSQKTPGFKAQVFGLGAGGGGRARNGQDFSVGIFLATRGAFRQIVFVPAYPPMNEKRVRLAVTLGQARIRRPSPLRRLRWAALILLLIAVVLVLRKDFGMQWHLERVSSGRDKSGATDISKTSSGGSARAADRAQRELEKKNLEAFRKAAEESAARDFANLARNSPVIPIAPGGKRLTTAAIESLGLNKHEVESITSVLASLRAEGSKDLSSRAELVTSAKSDGSGTTTYYIRARNDRGKEFSDKMLQALQGIVGEDRATRFMAGVERSDYTWKWGKYDMQFDFSQSDGATFVKYQYIDPASGRPTRFGESSLSSFTEEFGDLLSSRTNE